VDLFIIIMNVYLVDIIILIVI